METVQGGVPPYGVKETLVVNDNTHTEIILIMLIGSNTNNTREVSKNMN